LGQCDIGCSVYAKNTLDKITFPGQMSMVRGARAEPVSNLEPIAGGEYKVYYSDLKAASADRRRLPSASSSRRFARSTDLLLRCKEHHQTSAHISAQLGQGWSSNGDF